MTDLYILTEMDRTQDFPIQNVTTYRSLDDLRAALVDFLDPSDIADLVEHSALYIDKREVFQILYVTL